MRLGQLARKLAIKPVAIVDFLAQHNIRIDEEGNTKLEDDHVVLLLQQFAPAPVVAPKAKEETALESLTVNPAAIENKPSGEIEIPVTEIIEEEKIELIKAPKVELSGLKVLGKIDLPEPKKKETPPDTQEASASAEPEKQSQPDFRKPYPQRRERSNPPPSRKNPIAQQREHEAMESRKKREAGLELEKEKRTLHYLKRVNVTQPTKAVKIVHDGPLEEQPVVAEAPKTWWGRFMKWLNT